MFCLFLGALYLPNVVITIWFVLFIRSTPDYLIWLKYISWFYYGNEMLVVNQWKDVNIISKYISWPSEQ